MKKSKSLLYFYFIISILILSCNINEQDTVSNNKESKTEKKIVKENYMNILWFAGFDFADEGYSEGIFYAPEMDKYTYNDYTHDIYMAKRYYYYTSGQMKIEFIKWNGEFEHVNKVFQESFGKNFSCDPAFCLNKVDNIPQILVKKNEYDNKMVHFWRKPEDWGGPTDPVYGRWIQQIVLNTECYGSPSMISNLVPPHNLEVVYRDMTGKKIRHIWREAQGAWHEESTLLPLEDGVEAISDPDITQTADGYIHATAIVKKNNDYKLAYWVRESHSGVWGNPCYSYSSDITSGVSNYMNPSIIACQQEKIVIMYKGWHQNEGSVDFRNEFNGFISVPSPNHQPNLLYYGYPLRIYPQPGIGEDFHYGYVYNLGGIGVLTNGGGGWMYMAFTERYNTNMYQTYLIHVHANK